jgi:hypothetical protein
MAVMLITMMMTMIETHQNSWRLITFRWFGPDFERLNDSSRVRESGHVSRSQPVSRPPHERYFPFVMGLVPLCVRD